MKSVLGDDIPLENRSDVSSRRMDFKKLQKEQKKIYLKLETCMMAVADRHAPRKFSSRCLFNDLLWAILERNCDVYVYRLLVCRVCYRLVWVEVKSIFLSCLNSRTICRSQVCYRLVWVSVKRVIFFCLNGSGKLSDDRIVLYNV
jgi:hypothetical protein